MKHTILIMESRGSAKIRNDYAMLSMLRTGRTMPDYEGGCNYFVPIQLQLFENAWYWYRRVELE